MSTAEQIVGVGPTVDHATYVGGSDIAALVGLSPYKTALDVWAEKTGRKTFAGNARTRAGNAFERAILSLYAEERSVELMFPGTLVAGVTGATPDAISDDAKVVQAKMVGIRQADRWGPALLGADGIPQEVLAQIHYEVWHAEKRLEREFGGHAVAQIGTEQRVYEVPIDREFSAALVEAGERFWRDHVVTGRMPIVGDGPDMNTLRLVYQRPGALIRAMTDEDHALALEYARHRDAESAAREAKEAVGAQLAARIGDDTGFSRGFGRSVTKATWAEERGKVDWKACAQALGATDKVAEQYRKEPSRVLRVFVKGE
jgi:predicted phage-related endonuclease